MAVGAVLRLANFGAACRCGFCVSAGSWRFLAVLGGAWALAGRKWEPKIDKTEAWGGKNGAGIKENEVLGVSGSLWGARRAPGGSRSAKMELRRSSGIPFWLHLGTPFSRYRPFGPLWAGRFRQKGDLEGVLKWGRKRERTRS